MEPWTFRSGVQPAQKPPTCPSASLRALWAISKS